MRIDMSASTTDSAVEQRCSAGELLYTLSKMQNASGCDWTDRPRYIYLTLSAAISCQLLADNLDTHAFACTGNRSTDRLQ